MSGTKNDRPTTVAVHENPESQACVVFRDADGRTCSVQESSAYGEPTVILGTLVGAAGEDMFPINRMRLTRDQVRDLMSLLVAFSECGRLGMERH